MAKHSWGYCGIPAVPWKPTPGIITKRRVTRQDADEMVRLRRAGLTQDAIAAMFRVDRGTVGYHLRKLIPTENARLTLEAKRRGKLPVTKVERNAQIVELRRQGLTLKEVALAMGTSKRVAVDICLRMLPVEETEALNLRKVWRLDDPAVLEAITLRRSGLPIRAAAARVGMPSSSLFRALKKSDL